MPESLKVVFFGSPELAIPSFRAILNCPDLRLLAAVTQPDRPAGRGRALKQPPVKLEALEAGLDVLQPRTIRKQHIGWVMNEFHADYFVVVAYGKILPPQLLEMPRLGCVNLHLSLLPKYRGAAPINWALINGETVTGATTMLMDEGCDTGPILLRRELAIENDDTAETLGARLAEAGAELLVETLLKLAAGEIKPLPQDESEASHAPILKKEDGLVDWSLGASSIADRCRGLHPWPGIFSHFRGKQIKLLRVADAGSLADPLPHGTLLRDGNRLLAACGEGSALQLLDVQLAGGRPISAADFANGHQPKPGERLGEQA